MLQCRNGVEKGLESSFLRPMNLKLEGRSTGLPLPMSGLKCKSFEIFPPISDLLTKDLFFPFSRPDDSNRRHYEAVRGRVDSGESTSFMRSLLGMCQLFVCNWVSDDSVANFTSFLAGVQPFCIHDEAQFSCTFTPLCWMAGGVAMNGCDSMLYSCCVSHTIARRQVSCLFTIGLNHASDPSSNPTTPKFLGKSNLFSISIFSGFC